MKQLDDQHSLLVAQFLCLAKDLSSADFIAQLLFEQFQLVPFID
jgi:hypothetical protein